MIVLYEVVYDGGLNIYICLEHNGGVSPKDLKKDALCGDHALRPSIYVVFVT